MNSPFLDLFAAVRGLHLASLMLLFGSAMLLLRLRAKVPELGLESSALGRARLAAAILALATAPAWLALATAQMANNPHAAIDPAALALTLQHTLFGQMLAARFVILLLLGVALLLRREAVTALLAGAALALVSVTSHAAAESPAGFTAIGIVNDTLHLLCGGIWIGGLAVLASIMAQRSEAPRLLGALSLFTERAMIAVLLLVLTGMINAATIILGSPGHAAKLYLGVLGTKLVLVLVMVLLAVMNNFKLMPRLAKANSRLILKGNITWELALGVAVILLAGLLGLLPPTF